MDREKILEENKSNWKKISRKWQMLSKKHNLPLTIFGLPALIKMKFESPLNLEYKTLITQEMLKKVI